MKKFLTIVCMLLFLVCFMGCSKNFENNGDSNGGVRDHSDYDNIGNDIKW